MAAAQNADKQATRAKWDKIADEMDRELARDSRGQRAGGGPNWKFFSPLLWAPVFPVIRIALKNRPSARTRAFVGAIALANIHGMWLVNDPDGDIFRW